MSITAPAGFRAAGVTAGLKPSGRPDLAVVVNDGPDHHGAAVFTGNRVEAAPVTWSRQVLADGRVDAVVLTRGVPTPAPGLPGSLIPTAVRSTSQQRSGSPQGTWSSPPPV